MTNQVFPSVSHRSPEPAPNDRFPPPRRGGNGKHTPASPEKLKREAFAEAPIRLRDLLPQVEAALIRAQARQILATLPADLDAAAHRADAYFDRHIIPTIRKATP
jgi:hypothetical protein